MTGARLTIPTPPRSGEPQVVKYLSDLTNYIQLLQNQVNNSVILPTVAYADTGNLRGVKSQLVFVPDHPSGPSIIIYDGTVFQRFTAAGVL